MPCRIVLFFIPLSHNFFSFFFFFNDTATTEIYTLSLHDALPISTIAAAWEMCIAFDDLCARARYAVEANGLDRKSTRLNSSHITISYAVFCLKKKKKKKKKHNNTHKKLQSHREYIYKHTHSTQQL